MLMVRYETDVQDFLLSLCAKYCCYVCYYYHLKYELFLVLSLPSCQDNCTVGRGGVGVVWKDFAFGGLGEWTCRCYEAAAR